MFMANKRSAAVAVMGNKRNVALSPMANKKYSSYFKRTITRVNDNHNPDIGLINNSNCESSYNERKIYNGNKFEKKKNSMMIEKQRKEKKMILRKCTHK